MRVFVTGASGWIGRGVVPELTAAGHTVLGLARSEASERALQEAGAEVLGGSLDDLDALREGAASTDGVIHLAFKHDLAFTGDFAAAAEADHRAIETFGEALAGSHKPFVIASGVLGLAPGRVATERDGLVADGGGREPTGPERRLANAQLTLAMAGRGIRSSVVRLPPSCHGDGDNGFIPAAIGFAREKGAAAYVGDGSNRWPAVHRDDAATVFRLALESAPAGSALHAIGDEGVPIREVAAVFAEHLDLPAVSVAAEQAGDYVGWLGLLWGLDSPASGAVTRELLGWQPARPGLIADLEEGHYFA